MKKELNLKNLPELAHEISIERRYIKNHDMTRLNKAKKTFEEAATSLSAILSENQGKARERLFTAETLCEMLYDVQKKVSTKKALNGTKVVYDFGQTFPSAYKYTPQSTTINAEYRNGSWRITDIYRDTCPNHNQAGRIEFSETAKLDIITRASEITYLYN